MLIVLVIVAAIWLFATVFTGGETVPEGPLLPDDGGPVQSGPADPASDVRWVNNLGLGPIA